MYSIVSIKGLHNAKRYPASLIQQSVESKICCGYSATQECTGLLQVIVDCLLRLRGCVGIEVFHNTKNCHLLFCINHRESLCNYYGQIDVGTHGRFVTVSDTLLAQGLHLNEGCLQSISSISPVDLPASSASTSTCARFLLLIFIQANSAILRIRTVLLVAKFSPLPMR